MKQGCFKAIVTSVVLAACVFSFAAGLTVTAEEAQAALCGCFDCWPCARGDWVGDVCVIKPQCGAGGGPCCFGPPPIQ